MKLLGRPHGKSLPMMLAAAVLISTTPMVTGCSRGDEPQASPSVAATQEPPSAAPTAAPPPPPSDEAPGPAPGAASAEELQELVSPIALYPDVLVAQILAGSTYPTQVVEADRWLKQNSNLTGDALAAQANAQPWDPSIKSLTQFPSVLDTMNKSLGWTSALGEAYYNQPGDVMTAIQVLRNKAMAAGTLKTTAQQTVETQPAPPAEQGATQPSVQQTVIIQPAQPNTVYVPQYNPTSAYGAPVAAPAGYTGSDLLLTGVLSFGAGILLGSLINNGNNYWGCDWHGGYGGYSSSVKYNNNVYVTNNNNYPGRYPNGGNGYPNNGYPGNGNGRPGYGNGGNGRPGYGNPGNGGQRPPGGRPPYNGGGPGNRPNNPGGGGPNRPNNPGIPTTRPYKPGSPENKPNFGKPNFPKPSTLPNNPELGNRNKPGKGNQKTKELAQNRPGQGGNANRGPSTRPAAPNKPANRAADPARGYNKDRNSTGGRNGAFSGYEAGSSAQANNARGKSSFNGNKGGGGGGGSRGGGGGGNRGGGGGGGNRGGGGGGNGGKRKNR